LARRIEAAGDSNKFAAILLFTLDSFVARAVWET
jgi:hypothetical protein